MSVIVWQGSLSLSQRIGGSWPQEASLLPTPRFSCSGRAEESGRSILWISVVSDAALPQAKRSTRGAAAGLDKDEKLPRVEATLRWNQRYAEGSCQSRARDRKETEPMALELRPSCEHCNKQLSPNSTEAMICSFECTFCIGCVEHVLDNVCPNCGGGFCPRPIRPATNWKADNFVGARPASTTVKHRPVDEDVHEQFSAPIRGIPPAAR
jgi:hypothetical protein